MLSTDANIFDETSNVRERMKWYGSVFEELHIIVCARTGKNPRPRQAKMGGQKTKISENVFVYSTLNESRFLCLWEAYRIAKRIIQTINYKPSTTNYVVITAQDPFEVGLVGYALKNRFGVPLQLQIHTDFLSPYFWRESFKNKIRVLLARFLIPRADGIRVVSERITNQLKTKNYKLKTDPVVLPIFVNIEQIRATIITTDLHKKYPQFDFIILIASRLTREKNIKMAIEAMRLMRDPNSTNKHPNDLNILLLIVGDGPELKTLKLQTTNYKLQTNIIFEPAVDFETLVSYYKTADLFLLTSNYEGYGRTVIEAAAAGCSVVMTDVGIAGEIIHNDESGIIVPVGNADAIATAISTLCRNTVLRTKFMSSGHYNIEKKVVKDKTHYVKLYCETLLRIV